MRAILQRTAATGMMLACLMTTFWVQPLSAQQNAVLPAIYDLLPADTDMAVVVPSLSALQNGLGLLNQALDMGVPMLADPLGEFKRTTGVNRGMDDDGALAVAVLGLEHANEQNEPDILMFVPVANYADFLGNFDAQANQGLTQIQMPGGHIGWSRQVGDHAVLSRNQQLLTDFQPGQAQDRFARLAGRQAQQYLNDSHIALVLDPRPLLQRGLTELQQAVPQAGQDPNANAILQFYVEALNVLARDTQGFMLAGEILEQGVNMTSSAQFQPGSQVAGYFGPGSQAAAMTNRLPNQPFLLASSWDAQAINLSRMLTDVLDAIQVQDGWFLELMRVSKPLLDQIRSAAQAYYVPQQMGFGASMFASVTAMDVGDGNAYLQAYRQMTDHLNELRINMAAPGQQPDPNMPPPVMTFNATYTENALQVDGVRVDQYQVITNLPPQMMAEMGQMAGMLMMMGGMQQTGYIAARGQYVVMTSTPDAQLIRAGLAALQNGAGLGQQETLAQVRAALTEQPASEVFISVSGIVQTVNQFLQMMMPGQVQPIQAPADLPPIGQSITAADGSITSRLHVPMPVVTFTAETTRHFAGLMQREAEPNQAMPQHDFNQDPF